MNNVSYRIIFHIDMNCFFASCEIAENPSLKDKPLIIARDDAFRKSIILTATYEARKYGIYTTMLVKDAIKLCPQVIILEPHYNLYAYYSKQFFEYLNTITNKVEPMSIDEGFLDVTEVCQKVNALELAKTIQQTLMSKFHLPCSIGIAPNKFLAKMASDMKKPLGITVLRKREIPEMLWPLPIDDMMGVGKKTAPRLKEIGINTIGDVANYKNIELLNKTVGKAMTEYLKEKSMGIDNTPVIYDVEEDSESISNSHTFDFDEIDLKTIKDTLKILTNSVSYRLEKDGLKAYTIGLQLKYNTFKTVNRSKGLSAPINDNIEMYSVINELFDEYYDDTPIRLVGVFANRLIKKTEEVKQYSLFDDLEKIEKENYIHKLLGKINNTLGSDIINIGINKLKK